jgi:hypothetical protein
MIIPYKKDTAQAAPLNAYNTCDSPMHVSLAFYLDFLVVLFSFIFS